MRLNLGVKLIGAFIVIFIMIIAMGLGVLYFMGEQQEAQLDAVQSLEDFIFFAEREIDHLNWVNDMANMFVTGQQFTGQLDHTKCALGTWYYELVESPDFQALPEDYRTAFLLLEEPHRLLHATAHDIMHLMEGNPSEEDITRAAVIYENETRRHMANVRAVMAELNALLDQQKVENLALADQQATLTMQILIFVTLAVIIVGVLVALALTRSITKPVNDVVGSLKEMAESGGDLTRRIDVKSKDEIGDLAYWFNAFISKLQGIMLDVRSSTEAVTSGSTEIATGNQDLSQRTEEQAASLQEVASTVDDIASSMSRTTENASAADRLTNSTMDTVSEGEQVIGEMQHAMQEITSSSNEIAEIISAVNDIAFQTNLLALNAAVEAARAGEQGRGFAVVAQEVRNLAGRSADSAKEIEKRIQESIVRVGKGNELMGKTEEVLQVIVENTRKSTDLITEISASFKEQTASVSDIHKAIDELNQVTQQNAALVEEIASSSEAMTGEAGHLSKIINQFKLED